MVNGTRMLVPPHQKGGVAHLVTVAFLSLHDYVVAHSACICAAALRCAHTCGMGVSPFRPTTPLLLQATQPKEMTMPVVVGCGLVGAYV